MTWDPDEALSILIHGAPGAGKTNVAATAPTPLLLLDVEGRSRFVQGRKVRWDPQREAPPTPDGTWDICVVQARDWATFKAATDYIIAGKHAFRSVTLDSVGELQKRCKDKLMGGDGVMSERLWGELLTSMENQIRALRDSATHPTAPVQCLVLTSWSEMRDGEMKPFVQGSLAKTLPAMVDVMGYLYVDPTDASIASKPEARRLLVQPAAGFSTKDATSALPNGGVTGTSGGVIAGPINIAQIIEKLYPKESK